MIETPTLSVYGTGFIARLCGVSTATVAKWIDAGELRGYRIPGRLQHRRVMRADLVVFMKKYKLPLEALSESPSC